MTRNFIQMGPRKTRASFLGTGGQASWEGKAFNATRFAYAPVATFNLRAESEVGSQAHWPMPASFTCRISETHRDDVLWAQTSSMGWRGSSRAGARLIASCRGSVGYEGEDISQGDSSLPAMPTVPANAKNLFTTFGISPSTTLNQQTALQNALNALVPGDFLVFPAGTYRHSGRLVLSVAGVTLWSEVATPAILHSTSPTGNQAALAVQANNCSVYGFTFHAETTTRQSGTWDSALTVVALLGQPRISGAILRRNRIEQSATTPNGACGAGIIMHHASNYLVAENFVSRTLADGIHNTQGSFNGRVIWNTVRENGDDMISVVSYAAGSTDDPVDVWAQWDARRADRLVHNILIANNDVSDTYGGRGITVVGGEDVTIRDNLIDRITVGGAVMVAREGNYFSFGVNNILVEDNIITHCQTTEPAYEVGTHNPGSHAALELNCLISAEEAAVPGLWDAYAVQNVMMQNNNVTDAGFTGARVNPRGSSFSKLGKIGITNNTFQQIAGTTVSIQVTPTPTFNIYCPGNTDDGVPVSNALCSSPAPVVTGYEP